MERPVLPVCPWQSLPPCLHDGGQDVLCTCFTLSGAIDLSSLPCETWSPLLSSGRFLFLVHLWSMPGWSWSDQFVRELLCACLIFTSKPDRVHMVHKSRTHGKTKLLRESLRDLFKSSIVASALDTLWSMPGWSSKTHQNQCSYNEAQLLCESGEAWCANNFGSILSLDAFDENSWNQQKTSLAG